MDLFNLTGMSAEGLESLSKKAARLAAQLREKEPSAALAVAAGIKDRGYNTPANGYISSYSGEVEITMDYGSRWRAVGHGPRGRGGVLYSHGHIEFFKL